MNLRRDHELFMICKVSTYHVCTQIRRCHTTPESREEYLMKAT